MRIPYESGTVRVSSPFGERWLNGAKVWHNGIDLVGSNKNIVAAVSGVVKTSTMLDKRYDKTLTWQWGNYVRIDGDDGLTYFYCHMAKRLVSVGQRVHEGEVIGIEGNTGYSFGTHCHFEVRRNGESINPAELLGIKNTVGTVCMIPAARGDEYSHDGLVFCRAKYFRIVYHDEKKRSCTAQRYINGGFFANYADARKRVFTLPVANLMCDVDVSRVDESAKKYILPHVEGRKLRYDIADNQSGQYKGKFVSTLVVPRSGKAYIADMGNVPSDAVYAISGVPTVRNGDDVDYYRYVKAQGWDDSCMGAACRNWVGVRDGEIWIISGKTPVKNYIYGMWFWQRVRDEGFEDVICLDGGGSYVRKPVGNVGGTAENRRVNNIIEF